MKGFKRKLLATLCIFTMVFNFFSPFSTLLNNNVYALTSLEPSKPVLVMHRTTDIQTTGSNRWFQAQIAVVGDVLLRTFDIKFTYDSSKIVLANKMTKASATTLTQATNQESSMSTFFAENMSYLNLAENSFRYVCSVTTPENPVDYGDCMGLGYTQGYLPIETITFKVVDPSITEDDLTTDMFTITPNQILVSGMDLVITDSPGTEGNNKKLTDLSYFAFGNFTSPSKSIDSVTISNNPTRNTYAHGDSIDLTGGKILITYTDSTTKEVDMATDDKIALQTLTADVDNPHVNLTYDNKYNLSYDITVTDPVENISLKTPPTRLEYNNLENIDLTGAVITAITKSGKSSDVILPNDNVVLNSNVADLSKGTITGTGDDNLPCGNQNISLTYQDKKTNFTILVNDTVDSIEMNQSPKNQYNYGDLLDLSLGSIMVNTTSGATIPIALNDGSVQVTGYDSNKLGMQTLTVTFLGATTTYAVNVNDFVEGIRVDGPTKTEYNYGEDLNLDGGTVTEVMASGADGNTVTLTSDMVSGYDKESVGIHDIDVTYNGMSTTFEVTINDYEVGLDIKSPNKTTYNYGESLDLTGGIVRILMASGTTYVGKNLTSDMVTGYDPNRIGTQTLTVSYEDHTGTFDVQVLDPIQTIAITSMPKIDYAYNDTLDVTGGKITATTLSGATNVVDMTSDMVSGFDSTPEYQEDQTKVSQTLAVTYEGKTINYDVTVTNQITKIEMLALPKTDYNVNEALNITGGKVTVTRQTGEPSIINLTKAMVSGFDTTTEGEKTLTVSYMENEITKQTSFQINVVDSVIAISVNKNPTKTTYKYGENLDLAGGVLSVVKGSGTYSVDMTNATETGYNPYKLGDQTVTLTYSDKTATINVTVQDYVSDLIFSEPTKTEYVYGEELDLTGGSIQKVMASGAATEAVDLTDSSVEVTGYNPNLIGSQELAVNYAGLSKKFNVNVIDEVASIVLDSLPTKTDYAYNEDLDLTGGKLVATMLSGATNTIDITSGMVTGFDKVPTYTDGQTKKTENLTVTYEGKTANFDVTVTNQITSIEMTATPKTEYNVNDTLDVTGGKILVTRQNGQTQEIDLTEAMVSGFDTTTEGEKALTVSYTENGITKTTTYTINVVDSITAISVKNAPDKTTYNYGEDLDLTGGVITVVRGSGPADIPMSSATVSGYDKNVLGPQTVTLTYSGKTTSINVTVEDYVSDLILTEPTKIEYVYGEELDLTGGSIQKVMASGAATEAVALTDASVEVTGYNPNLIGSQELTVNYAGLSKKFNVNVIDEVASIVLDSLPTKTDYAYNEDLDLTGGKLVATMLSGATNTIDITSDMVTGFDKVPTYTDGQTKKTENLTVTYEGKTANFDVTVTNQITSIEMTATPKTEYNVNDTLDVTGGKILVTRQNSQTQEIDLTEAMISGFDTTTEGEKTLTVSYSENGITKTTTYTINVVDSITSISVKNAPDKTTYNYGEDLDLTGGVITVVRGSGPADIPMSSATVSGYDKNVLGPQTVTLTYSGKTASINVTVEDYVSDLILTEPTKTEYVYGEELDLTGGSIQKVMASGAATEAVALTDASVEVTGYDPNKTGSQELTVNYAGFTKKFNVEVEEPTVVGIEYVKKPAKTEYKYNDTLDVSGGIISVEYSDGSNKQVNITDDMVSGYNAKALGNQTLTVSYSGKILTYDINVSDYVLDITLVKPTKTEYSYGEALDLAGGSVQKVMASGTVTEAVNLTDASVEVTGYDPNKTGSQEITVNYVGISKKFNVTVKNPEITNIVLNNTPKTDYKYGEKLDLTGGTILVNYSDGTNEVVNITEDMVSGYNPTILGSQTVIVKYGDKSDSYNVNVSDYIASIEFNKPDKLLYIKGETLDLTGGYVREIMASGAMSDKISLTDASITVTGFDSSTIGVKTLNVKYKTFNSTYAVTIKDDIAKMQIQKLPDKTSYIYGETLDLTGGLIKVTRQSGEEQIVSMKDPMFNVTGYNSNKLGTQTINISAENETATFAIDVGDKYITTRFIEPTQKAYSYGDDLNTSGGRLEKVYISGKTEKIADITKDMVEGYDNKKVGAQTLKVVYGDKVYTYQIKLSDNLKSVNLDPTPNKLDYNYGESLDLTGGKLKVIKDSGVSIIDITPDMISGYDANKTGNQLITVTYQGIKNTFVVNVKQKPDANVAGTVETPTTSGKHTPNTEQVQKTIETPVVTVPEEKPKEEVSNIKPNQTEKPVEKPQEKPIENEKVPTSQKFNFTFLGLMIFAAILLILFIILLIRSMNKIKIMIITKKKKFIAGSVDVSEADPVVNIDTYVDKYPKDKLKILIPEILAKKLNNKTIKIKNDEAVIKQTKVKYQGDDIEIPLQ